MQSILLYPSCAISILHIAHCTSSTIAPCNLHIVHCNQHNCTWCRWKLYEFHRQISAHSAIWVQVGSAVQNGKRQLNNQLTSVSNCKTIYEGCEEELVKEHKELLLKSQFKKLEDEKGPKKHWAIESLFKKLLHVFFLLTVCSHLLKLI